MKRLGNKITFEEAYNNGADVNTLLCSLDSIIIKISSKFFKKVDFAIDKDDIAQEVRIHIWKMLTETNYLEGKNGSEAYKYVATAIRLWTLRTVSRQAAKVRKRNRIKQKTYVTVLILSVFNTEFLNNKAEMPCEVLVNRLKEACSDIENADKVFEFLAPSEDLGRVEDEVEFAGLPINAFYNAVNEIKIRAKDISYE